MNVGRPNAVHMRSLTKKKYYCLHRVSAGASHSSLDSLRLAALAGWAQCRGFSISGCYFSPGGQGPDLHQLSWAEGQLLGAHGDAGGDFYAAEQLSASSS